MLALAAGYRLYSLALRTVYPNPISFNEGWNAYYATAASEGAKLYGAQPTLTAVNYPPLSFHLVGLAGRFLHDPNFAGRLISLLSLAWVAACVAVIVRKMVHRRFHALLAALFCLAWFSLFAGANVGANEPQLLGHAVIMAGVVLYVLCQDSLALLLAAGLLCVVGGFVKHNLFSFPVGIGLHLFFRSKARFATWAAFVSALLFAGLVLTSWIDGGYFLQHLTNPRRFGWGRIPTVSGFFLAAFLPTLMLCILGHRRIAALPYGGVAWSALVVCLVPGIFFTGGAGVSVNVFFDAIIAMSIMAAILLSEFHGRASAHSPPTAVLITLAPILISAGPLVYGYFGWIPSRTNLESAAQQYAGDVAYMRSKPGAAICLNLLLCYDSGKPLIFDPYSTNERLETGVLSPETFAAKIKNQEYGVVELGSEPYSGAYFPDPLVAILPSYYRIERTSGTRIFYVPKR
ncbi:MAG TPA: hypothetical protein VGR73_15600 [Bryobacteraceae bacterium]|nr:hypothetical protein [Bryobacteraceae bacterium]